MGKFNKNKINIFFCINGLQSGGAEKQLNYISNYLSENYNISIFTINSKKSSYQFNSRIKIYKLSSLFSLFFFLKKVIISKPKIVFFILPKAYFIFGTMLIFFPKIKKALMRRSLNYYHKNLIYKFYEMFLHRFTHLFICNSISAKNNLIDFEKISKKKVLVIKNYIEPFKKYKSFKKINNFKILCISNFYRYKGHHLLLRSLSHIKDLSWDLTLFGEEREFKKSEIINYAKRLGLSKKISFINKVNNNCSFPFFKLGIILSNTESFPNAVLEYLSLKLPVLATNVGDIKYVVNKSNGILINTRNSKIISKNIKNLIFDKNIKKKSNYSNNLIKQYNNKNITLKKYKKQIEKILCVGY